MLSQFTREAGHSSLADLNYSFPKDVYPVGRLDADSEGLLLLTNNSSLNKRILDPQYKHNRSYLALLDGEITEYALLKLEKGIEITVHHKAYQTLPAKAERVTLNLPERIPSLTLRTGQKTSLIKLTLHEGKNRQVRKMTAAVGFPTLRLIRVSIEKIVLGELLPGNVLMLSENAVFKKLDLN